MRLLNFLAILHRRRLEILEPAAAVVLSEGLTDGCVDSQWHVILSHGLLDVWMRSEMQGSPPWLFMETAPLALQPPAVFLDGSEAICGAVLWLVLWVICPLKTTANGYISYCALHILFSNLKLTNLPQKIRELTQHRNRKNVYQMLLHSGFERDHMDVCGECGRR